MTQPEPTTETPAPEPVTGLVGGMILTGDAEVIPGDRCEKEAEEAR